MRAEAERLRSMRQELDQMAEWMERIAVDLESTDTDPDLVLLGVTEVAAFLGITPASVTKNRQRGVFAEPFVVLACGPIWRRSDIEQWRARAA